jgi:hypothetical protein
MIGGKSSVSRMITSVVMPVGTVIPNIGHLITTSRTPMTWGVPCLPQ